VRRREFITKLSRRAAWPLAARVQQMLPTIGLSDRGTISAWSQWISAFVQRWRELGWIKNRTVAIEYRWAEGCVERDTEIAVDFVRLKVAVIVTTAGVVGAVSIFAVANDPIAGSTWRIFK
jgi:putative tryptophan/tyrosine transport system substrate-binding protein